MKDVQFVKIVNKSSHPLPSYASLAAAGLDLRAYLPEDSLRIAPLKRLLVPTGLYIELPIGYEGQIRPRSGLALKQGLTLLNSPGTIDADYRGEIRILIINLSDSTTKIENGDRIAQLILSTYAQINWKKVKVLTESKRGRKGFGSTGLQ